jgi:hypothetical protein
LGKMLAIFVALQWTLQMALAGVSLATMVAAVRGIFNLSCTKVLSFFSCDCDVDCVHFYLRVVLPQK